MKTESKGEPSKGWGQWAKELLQLLGLVLVLGAAVRIVLIMTTGVGWTRPAATTASTQPE